MDVEQAQTAAPGEKRGGWITFPFILGNMFGTSVAIFGVTSNFMVYLIKQFNVGGVDAAQINNIVNGCSNLAPIAGAVLSDSSLGCFVVVVASSFLSLLGMVLFTLTATVGSLRPPPCPPGANACKSPSPGQNAVLYLAVALGCAGTGGTRFNLATMGANQFDNPRDQNVFFNWYFFVMYVAGIIATTAVVYVQDNVSWGWGFGICTAANAASVVVLLLGAGYYRGATPGGSPYVGLARVLVAATRKWRVAAAREEATEVEYYCGSSSGEKHKVPTGSFRKESPKAEATLEVIRQYCRCSRAVDLGWGERRL
ncbi:hypothetical protein Taro_039062 [Colocasia esculenta]|uniref:Uncharacterized protein n=1 Tax=Colocasia esculenta TaxID=4460 RepID=A0A843WL32_COLES|nr:hypothetical protein [Colocasia esculenta]